MSASDCCLTILSENAAVGNLSVSEGSRTLVVKTLSVLFFRVPAFEMNDLDIH